MTDDSTFERAARAWLELGPVAAPQRAVDAALRSIATTPQQRTFRVPRRFPRVFTAAGLAVGASILAVVIAGGLLFFSRSSVIGNPTPLPTPSSPLTSPVAGNVQLGSGWLVFEQRHARAVGLDLSIWAVRQDGSGLHEIAPEISGKQAPDISPDGTTVAFEFAGDELQSQGGHSSIWTAPIDGGPASMLAQACRSDQTCSDTNPAYSPDGRRIAFVRNGDRIAFVDLTTGTVSELSATGAGSDENPDGVQLTAHIAWPSWSNDQQIAYQLTQQLGDAPATTTIEVVNADNTYLRTIETPAGVTVGDPHWSPDGLHIVMSAKVDRYDVAADSFAIYTITRSGSEFTQLCAGTSCGTDPSWTRNGQGIILWRDGTWWVMDANGGSQRPINKALDNVSSLDNGAFVVRLQPDSETAIPIQPPPRPAPAVQAFSDTWASVGVRPDPQYPGPANETFIIDGTGLRLSTFKGEILSSISTGPAGSLSLTLENAPDDLGNFAWSCSIGDQGRYLPHLSPDGQTLSISVIGDNCAARAAVLTGDWTRWACDGGFAYCTHAKAAVPGVQSSIFKPFQSGTSGSFSYEFAAGWSQPAAPPTWPEPDSATSTWLSHLNDQGEPRIELYSDVVAQTNVAGGGPETCSAIYPATSSASGVADWLESLGSVAVSGRSPIVVGGLSGVQLDLAVKSGAVDACGGSAITLFSYGNANGLTLDGGSDEHARYIVLDPEPGSIVLIRIQTAGRATWEALISQAMPVVDTFLFDSAAN